MSGPINSYGIYFFGWWLKSLEEKLTRATNVGSIFCTSPNVVDEISELSKLKEVELFEQMGESIESWKDYISHLDIGAAKQLRDETIRWREQFESVLKQGRLAVVYLKTDFLDVEKLTVGLEKLLKKEEKDWLTNLEASCLEDARKCILIKTPTPAEFMCVRCAESILRRWYKWKTNKAIGNKGWGKLLDKLADEYGKEYPSQLQLLKYLKGTRDRLAHPDKTSSQSDAEHTFSMVIKFTKESHAVMQ